MKAKFLAMAVAAAVAAPVGAFALPATVMTEVALRGAPGPTQPIVATLDRGSVVDLVGCTDVGTWCQVSWNGRSGWTYAAYLSHEAQGRTVVVTESRTVVQVPTVVYQEQRASTVADKAPIIVDGPITGPILGTLKVGTAIEPPPATVQTYVTTHRVEPVYAEGEVVVGATLPSSIVVYEVPQYQYRYAVVNGRTVLVEPGTNRIVYVYR